MYEQINLAHNIIWHRLLNGKKRATVETVEKSEAILRAIESLEDIGGFVVSKSLLWQ